MSQKTYSKIWANAQSELSLLVAEELPDKPPGPVSDREAFFEHVATLYVRYIQILRQLEMVYDQLIHPQKREVVRGVLDGVMGRVLELKREMVDTQLSEFHNMDEILHNLKLRPVDLDIPIPHYFITEHSQERTDILKDIAMSKAITIIQAAERARQGRLAAKLKVSKTMESDEETYSEKEVSAALCIQKVWRGYIQWRTFKTAKESTTSVQDAKMHLHEIIAQTNEACTRIKQQEHEEDYQESIAAITKELQDKGPDMSNSMKDQIRQWFLNCRYSTGSFPDYPDEEDGGGALLLADKDPVQLMNEIAAVKEAKKNDNSKEKGDKKGKGKEKKTKGNQEEELEMQPSAFLSDLQEGNKIYEDVWQTCDESNNFYQRHVVQLIKEEKSKVIDAEIQVQVDEEMREELAQLKLNVDNIKDKTKKGKGKKNKGDKGKKGKTVNDPTEDRTLESLCQELVEQNLLKMSYNVSFQDYFGNYSYLGTILKKYDIEATPSLLDVRHVLTLYAVLPLGSQVVHEKAPLINSILLVGPAGIGKKMLVHAICCRTGATFFDLSPMNTAGKYPGDEGLNMMLHMVFKVARLLQPSVIWIGDAEKMFYKKVPKEEEEFLPKRLAAALPKQLKMIKGEDRVLIIGTTVDPTCANIKTLCKTYGKIIVIPRPDYGSRFILWKQLIKKQGGEITKTLDISSLAKFSDGYTPGDMIQVIKHVVTKQRIRWQGFRPLVTAEFVRHFKKMDPVYKKKEEALKKWYAKTPLGKKNVALQKKLVQND
ncbi:dynein regulatory complex protein 11-like [Solea solea]|uniref:dynein regulatory complex protein 11-like n=1 Tax=Solea solea TaxID=90069 RepID=UPI00272AA002|nr:dynein regulatory complex protein 11-like [Solea solea]